MPFPPGCVARLVVVAAILLFAFAGARASLAVETGSPFHYSADWQIWDRKANRIELVGNVLVRQPEEKLKADYAVLDLSQRIIYARGNCVYVTADVVIVGDEMNFNIDARTGSITRGRVSNDRFSLSGERINKLGPGRFQTHHGQYSTCWDCPQSWTFEAEDVDMEFEGYAYMSNVTARIKGVPSVWLPYLVLPMKTRRQSGFLFPRFGASAEHGVIFVLPFFWAINKSADMTIGFGEYAARGRRFEWEGRYALSDRSLGKANFYYMQDKKFEASRWALDAGQTQELPLGVEEKLRVTEVSDNRYPLNLGDVPGRGEVFVGSDLSFSYVSSGASAYLAGRRYRNLLRVDADKTERETGFDTKTVQVFPTAVVTTNDRFIFNSKVATGLTLGVSRFTRPAGPFDPDFSSVTSPGSQTFRPGIDPIREATRVSVTPSVYTTLRPLDVVSLVPSLEYRAFFYSFEGAVPTLNRGYLLFQTDLSTQLERVYWTSDPDIPRVKHLVRPILTYSFIPSFHERPSNHPFLEQMRYAQAHNFSGYNFDNLDFVPLDASPSNINYFIPLGNSLAYGLTTQLIRRKGKIEAPSATYQRTVELSAGQAVNFREFRKPEDQRRPLTRFFSYFNLEFDHLVSGTTYYYYPYTRAPRQAISTSASYVIERATHQKILTFDRSFTAGYTWNEIEGTQPTNNLNLSFHFSINDYILPSATSSYHFTTHKFSSVGAAIQFQSPSRCWRFGLNAQHVIDKQGIEVGWDLALNLTGSGFSAIGDIPTMFAAQQ